MNERFLLLPPARQDAIRNAAMKVFAAYGYANASTLEIAREAGISKGLLFHYFQNKRELHRSMYRYCTGLVADELARRRLEAEHDFFRLLLHSQQVKTEIMGRHRHLFEFLIRAYREEDPLLRSDLASVDADLVPESIAAFLARVDRSRFDDDVDIELLLKMLLWCADGCMREHFQKPVVDPEAINRDFSEVLMMLRRLLYRRDEVL